MLEDDHYQKMTGPPPSLSAPKLAMPPTLPTKRRINDIEVSVPIVYGTIAFYLGRKANESKSHTWTVYVRGATNEDLGVVIKRVVFHLHPTFNNPTRVIESPPFEVLESGWGEFEIGIRIFFHSDVCDKQLNLIHKLKLFADDDAGHASTKKPVIVENYDEIVFPDPSENFLARAHDHPAVLVPPLPAGLELPHPVPVRDMNEQQRGDTKDNQLCPWFINFSETDELLKLSSARQQVQSHIVKLRRQLGVIDGHPQPLQSAFNCYS